MCSFRKSTDRLNDKKWCNCRVGTSLGISTIHLACALRDGGGGHLIGSELEPTKARRAQENLNDTGLADLVEIRVGDALETLKDGIDGDVDLLFLDGAFSLYLPVLKLMELYLRNGAFVIGDNALEQSGGYLDYVGNPQKAIYRYHCRSLRVEVMNSP